MLKHTAPAIKQFLLFAWIYHREVTVCEMVRGCTPKMANSEIYCPFLQTNFQQYANLPQ